MTVRGFTAAFDWSRASTYAGTREDVSSLVTWDDVVLEVGRETSSAASSITASTLDMELDDSSLALAPERSSSPLFGKVVPGVPFKFDLTVSAATTTLYSGVLSDLQYDPTNWRMTVEVTDAWGKPSQQRLSTAVYQGQRTGDLIGVILDAIGWPADKRAIDAGSTVVPFWWEEGTDAATAVQKLVDSEGPPAIAYVQAGVFYFRDRFHRITDAACLTSQGTFTRIYPEGTGPGGDLKIARGSISYNHNLANIVNTVNFSVDVRQPAPLSAVWSQSTPLSVPAGQTLVIDIEGTDGFVGALVPVQTTNDAIEEADPNGDYILAYGSIASMSLSRTSGQSALLTIVGGGTDALLINLQVRGNLLSVAQTVQVSAADTSSQLSKGILTWPGSLPWANQYDALAIAQRIVSTYATARPLITFTIDGVISTTYLQQFAARKISDRITIRDDILGVNGDYTIEKIVRTIKGLGASSSLLTITAEPVAPIGSANPFTFDVAGQGFNQGTFAADGLDNPTTLFRFDTAGVGFNLGRFGS
jgi:hypothetical protein